METTSIDIREHHELVECLKLLHPNITLTDTMLTKRNVWSENINHNASLEKQVADTLTQGLLDLLNDGIESINPEVLVQIDGDRIITTIFT